MPNGHKQLSEAAIPHSSEFEALRQRLDKLYEAFDTLHMRNLAAVERVFGPSDPDTSQAERPAEIAGSLIECHRAVERLEALAGAMAPVSEQLARL